MGFIMYLFEQENEETLFNIWLHKEHETDFPTFKKKNGFGSVSRKQKALSKEEEEKQIEWSFQFVTPRNEAGDSV